MTERRSAEAVSALTVFARVAVQAKHRPGRDHPMRFVRAQVLGPEIQFLHCRFGQRHWTVPARCSVQALVERAGINPSRSNRQTSRQNQATDRSFTRGWPFSCSPTLAQRRDAVKYFLDFFRRYFKLIRIRIYNQTEEFKRLRQRPLGLLFRNG